MKLVDRAVMKFRGDYDNLDSDSIDLRSYGIFLTDVPIDWSESRVFVSRKSPDGLRKVIKVYDTPLSHNVITMDTLTIYKDLTNNAASMNIPFFYFHTLQGKKIECSVYIEPIEKVGYVKDGVRKNPSALSLFVSGETLSEVRHTLYGNIFDQTEIDRVLTSISVFLNRRLGSQCIKLDAWNIKGGLVGDSFHLHITDICEYISRVSGREPNFDEMTAQFGPFISG